MFLQTLDVFKLGQAAQPSLVACPPQSLPVRLITVHERGLGCYKPRLSATRTGLSENISTKCSGYTPHLYGTRPPLYRPVPSILDDLTTPGRHRLEKFEKQPGKMEGESHRGPCGWQVACRVITATMGLGPHPPRVRPLNSIISRFKHFLSPSPQSTPVPSFP